MKIVLTSCGIIKDSFKKDFYDLLDKNIEDIKLLYITTAIDGEPDHDKSWVNEEYKTILDLGIKDENITEFKLDKEINMNDYDVVYMMGGNTFYLLDQIRKGNWKDKIVEALNNGVIYIGSSAGSAILGKSIEIALDFDKNVVDMKDYTGLGLIDGIVMPHCNQCEDYVEDLKNKTIDKLYLLYDEDGIIIRS